MKNKTVLLAISLTVFAAIAMLLLMKKQADEAREVSRNIMEQFRTVDESLHRTTDSIENTNDSLEKNTQRLFDKTK